MHAYAYIHTRARMSRALASRNLFTLKDPQLTCLGIRARQAAFHGHRLIKNCPHAPVSDWGQAGGRVMPEKSNDATRRSTQNDVEHKGKPGCFTAPPFGRHPLVSLRFLKQ